MASGQFAIVYRQIERLFRSGSVAGLTEGQLLDRFVTHRDDTAFEAIVARHGATVLGVCRALLHDPNDVDDAFQATFLVLVKKADSLRQRDLLGNWLYGVAYRVARRARADAARRHLRESTGPEPVASSGTDVDLLDVRPMLHDEINRLPDSYRTAVVLCFLEGRTHEEAARELGWPIGTVKGRLARAKEMLRDRLSRRGLAVPAGAIVVVLAKEGRAAVSHALLESTTTAALAVAVTPLAAISTLALSPHVIALAQGALHTMSTTKLKLAATAIVAGLISAPGVLGFQAATPAKPASATETRSTIVKPSVPPDDLELAEARLLLAEEAALLLKKSARGGLPLGGGDANLWSKRLTEARKEVEEARKRLEGPAYEYNQAVRELAKAKAAEARLKSIADQGMELPDPFEFLEAKFRRIEAEERVARLTGPPKPSPAGTSPQKVHPADLNRNARIDAALEKVVNMHFPQETSLEVVLKYVKEKTKDASGRSIPIYLDPVAFAEAEKTFDSPVTLDIDGLPLRTTLRLLLRQLNLEYRVRSGLLYIANADTFNEQENLPAPKPPETVGGMGGFQ
jgi:RNA polymerase sigma factor (sigma-70 family)